MTATQVGPTSAQFVTLAGGGTSVRVLRGQTPASVTGGYGGWTQVPRPRRKALTQWDGAAPYEVTFSVLFDGIFDGSGSVESDIAKLERLARSPAAGVAPPVVAVDAGIPHADRSWVIEDLQWDPNPVYNAKGDRIRHECTIVLLEHVGGGVGSKAQDRARAATRAPSTTPGATYTVRAGDTLQSIAAAQLGDASRWAELADINLIRDPRNIAAGQLLRLP